MEREGLPDSRKTIEASLKKFRMLWDDARADRSIRIPIIGAEDAIFTASTPDSLAKADASFEKSKVMKALEEAFNSTTATKGFKTYVLEGIGPMYNFGLSSEHALAFLGVRPNQGNLGLFEPGKTHDTEKRYLEGALKTQCLMILGHLFISMTEEEEDKTTLRESVELVRGFFVEDEKWAKKEDLLEAERQSLPSGISILAIAQPTLEQLSKLIGWADEFRKVYQDDSFVEPVERVRPILQYFDRKN